MFNIEIPINFNFPYKSVDMAEEDGLLILDNYVEVLETSELYYQTYDYASVFALD